MRIDGEQKLVEIGVRELVGREGGRWDIPMLPRRAELGRDMHQQRRSRRSLQEPSHQSEISISHTLFQRGHQIKIQGRMDGLYRRDEWLVVEEFKSVALEAHELRALTPLDLPGARLQLGIYLLALEEQGQGPLRGELVLGSIYDRDVEWVLELDPFPDEVRRFLSQRLDELLDEWEARAAWLEQRREVARKLPFPHPQVRPVQTEILEELQNCFLESSQLLLEAPTGTGKTAASLYAAMKYAYEYDKKVVFATAKTSGQRSALQTLQRLHTQGVPLRALVITAREKICPQPVVYCHPDHCPYADRFVEKVNQSRILPQLLASGPLDREDLARAGELAEACPFELSLELLSRVDVVVCDYNYVFDPAVALSALVDEEYARNSLLIVDEAHNLVGRSRDYYSPLLSWHALQMLQSWGEQRGDSSGARAANLAGEILGYMYEQLEDGGLLEVAEGRVGIEPDLRQLVQWQYALASMLLDDPLRRRNRPVPGEEDLLLACYRQVAAFTRVALFMDEAFTAFAERLGEEVRLRILCHDASRQLRERLSAFHAVVGMSATLTPGPFYRELLGFESQAPIASFSSPFPRERRGVFVVSDVPDRYAARQGSIPRIREVVSQVLAARRGNYALYLPSFEFLEQMRGALESEGYELLVQDPRMDDAMRSALIQRLSQPLGPRGLFRGHEGRLLAAVQGGSFAEGIEWPEGVLSGLIIVSPGLPRMSFENQRLRHYFEERGGNGFEYTYLYPGMARVVQAAGRLIRRMEDRGVIVLVGERFAERRYSRLFPREWYEETPEELVVEDLPGRLEAFWRGQRRR